MRIMRRHDNLSVTSLLLEALNEERARPDIYPAPIVARESRVQIGTPINSAQENLERSQPGILWLALIFACIFAGVIVVSHEKVPALSDQMQTDR
jgi:hypothetical protein